DSIAASTFWRVASLTDGSSFRTRETVFGETPVARATSSSRTRMVFRISCRCPVACDGPDIRACPASVSNWPAPPGRNRRAAASLRSSPARAQTAPGAERAGAGEFFFAVAAGEQADAQRAGALRREHVPHAVAHHHGAGDVHAQPFGGGEEQVGVGLGVAHLVAGHYWHLRGIDAECFEVVA